MLRTHAYKNLHMYEAKCCPRKKCLCIQKVILMDFQNYMYLKIYMKYNVHFIFKNCSCVQKIIFMYKKVNVYFPKCS